MPICATGHQDLLQERQCGSAVQEPSLCQLQQSVHFGRPIDGDEEVQPALHPVWHDDQPLVTHPNGLEAQVQLCDGGLDRDE